jgi:hypothetical protein
MVHKRRWHLWTRKLYILHHWKHSPCVGGKNFLHPCSASYQKVIITDISSLMLEISGSKPPKNQKLTQLKQNAINKHPTWNTNCRAVPTPITSNAASSVPYYDISCSLGKQFHQRWLSRTVTKWEQVSENSLLHAQLCHPYQFPDLLMSSGVLLQFSQQPLLTIFIFIITLKTAVDEGKLFIISDVVHFQHVIFTTIDFTGHL